MEKLSSGGPAGIVLNTVQGENPLKMLLTVYLLSHAYLANADLSLARDFKPFPDWLLPRRFPPELLDADLALQCSKMAAVIQNPLKA